MAALMRRNVGVAGLIIAIAGCVGLAADLGPPLAAGAALIAGLLLGAAGIALNWRDLSHAGVGRGVRAGTGTFFYACIVFGVVILANFIADRHHWRWDASLSRTFSLSEFTRNVVGNLDGPVRIIAFLGEGADQDPNPQREFARKIVREYGFLSGKVTVDVFDPLKEPGVAKRYNVRQEPTIIVEKGGAFVQATSGEETAITSAILALTREKKKTIVFLNGHGERLPSIQSGGGYAAAARDLTSLNYEVRELLLSREGEVPAGCDVLIIAGPETPLSPEEVAALAQYLERGGRLLAMTEPLSEERLAPVLELWGLRALPAVIVDRKGTATDSLFTPVLTKYEDHPIVRSIGKNPTLFPTASPVLWFETKDSLLYHSYLLRANPEAWADSDLQAVRGGEGVLYQSGSDLMDDKGLPVGAVAFRRSWEDVTKQTSPGGRKEETRVVLFGDCDFASDAFYGSQWNSNLFVNAVNWLAEEEVLIGSRQPPGRQLSLLMMRRLLRRSLSFLAVPMVLMGLIGAAVWWRRRRL